MLKLMESLASLGNSIKNFESAAKGCLLLTELLTKSIVKNLTTAAAQMES
jgi:hypothetical protein